jgi:hypothetical protein
MTNELLAIDKRISHLRQARALLADFLKTEQIRRYRGHRNYFGNFEKKAIKQTSTPTRSEKVDAGVAPARKVRRTSATKSGSAKLASVIKTRTIKSASKPKLGKKKARVRQRGLAPQGT